MNENAIDFVITWVDGNDPAWLKEKEKYQTNSSGDYRESRFRDWDNLKYWFRGVEKFAPWVHKIYFITWGHIPEWLDLNNTKLVVVRHQDYIPKEYLPTFSSRPIDMNLHRIPDLEEQFVYFNDDMFLLSDVKPEDFFRDGLPCDTAILNAICIGYGDIVSQTKTQQNVLYTAAMFDMLPINRNFNKTESIKKNWTKWFNYRYFKESIRTLLLTPWRGFPGFISLHLPYSYLKSTYEEVWEKEGALLDQTSKHKFRENTDLNHWVFSYWQLAKGTFAPRSPKIGKMYGIYSDMKKNDAAICAIEQQKYKMICLNDSVEDGNFENVKEQVNKSLEKILPNKSSFEK